MHIELLLQVVFCLHHYFLILTETVNYREGMEGIAPCLFSEMFRIIGTITVFACLSLLGIGYPTQVKAGSQFEHANATSLPTINICDKTELYLEPNLTSGAAAVLLLAGENNKNRECSLTARVENRETVQLGIIHLQTVLDYSSNYVYIETSPNNSYACENHIVTFPSNWSQDCFVSLIGNFTINIKGDSRLTFQATWLIHPQPNCLDVVKLAQNTPHTSSGDEDYEQCPKPIAFNKVVYCQVYKDFHEYYRPLTNITACNFTCPINSSCTLGHQTITASYVVGNSENTLLIFPDVHKIIALYWAERQINSLNLGAFDDFYYLEILWLHSNKLIEIYPGLFNSLTKLRALYFSYQTINEIRPGNVFNDLQSLERLYLHSNDIKHLQADLFHGLTRLTILYLHDNHLTELHPSLFADLTRVVFISLNINLIQKLPSQLFKSGVSLQVLNLANNHLTTFESDIFQTSNALKNLDLRGNDLKWIDKNAFKGIHNITKVLVDDYSTCCFVKSAQCYATNPKPVYLTCERLLSNQGLRISMWVLGFGALFGNLLIIMHWVSRWRRNSLKDDQFLLMVNLSLSDLLMGFYLLILTSVDAYYADYFPSFAEKWRQSILCKVAGSLSVFSSQGSVFFITLISMDRFISVKYPFSRFRLRKRPLKIVIVLLWISAFLIAVVPTCLPNISPDVYDVSEVCIGLPMSRKLILSSETHIVQASHYNWDKVNVDVADIVGSKPGMYYAIAIFIVLNLTCFLMVAFCYIQIFITANKSRVKSGRSQASEADIRMAINMSAVVLTDFCCWVPIIIICILVQSGLIVVSPVMYAWTVAFILPINSAVNPIVYSGVTKIVNAKWLKWQFAANKGTGDTSNVHMKSISKTDSSTNNF